MNSYKANIACSVFFIAVAVAVWFLIPVGIVVSSHFSMGNEMLNSQFMPRVMAIALALASLANIIMTLFIMKLSRRVGKPDPVIKMPVLAEEMNVLRIMGVFFLCAVLLGWLGFIPATSISVVAVLALLRVRQWQYYLICLAFAILVYFVFTRILYVALP